MEKETIIAGDITINSETGLLVPAAMRVEKPIFNNDTGVIPDPIIQLVGYDKALEYCTNTYMGVESMPMLTIIDQNEVVWRISPPVFPVYLAEAMELIDVLATLKSGKKFNNAYDINITLPPEVEIDMEKQNKTIQWVFDKLGVQYVYRLSCIRRHIDFFEFFILDIDSRNKGHYNRWCGQDGGSIEIKN